MSFRLRAIRPARCMGFGMLFAAIAYLLWTSVQTVGGRTEGMGRGDALLFGFLPWLGVVSGMVFVLFRRTVQVVWLDVCLAGWWLYYLGNAWIVSDVPCGTDLLRHSGLWMLYFSLRVVWAQSGVSRRTVCRIAAALLAICGGYEAWIGLCQLYGDEPSLHDRYPLTGSFFNPGPYSAYLAVAWSVCVAYLVGRNLDGLRISVFSSWQRGLCFCLFLGMCMALPATWSRAAFIACAVVWLFLFGPRYRRYWPWALGIAVGGSVLLYFLKQGSADSRLLIWAVSLRAWGDSLWWGEGIGGFFRIFSEKQTLFFHSHTDAFWTASAGVPDYAFNELLKIGVEQGIIGVLFALAAAGMVGRRLWLSFRPLAYGWLALCVFALFSYPFSLLPFQLLAVLFAFLSAATGSRQKGVFRLRPVWGIPLVGMSIAAGFWLNRAVAPRVEAAREYALLAGLNDRTFLKDYEAMYPALNDNPYFLFDYGKMLRGQNRFNDSNALLQEGAMLSCDPMFLVLMGHNYRSLGAPRMAEESYQKAFSLLPNRMYPLYCLLDFYVSEGDTDRAMERARQICRFSPKISSKATEEMQRKAREYMKNRKWGKTD